MVHNTRLQDRAAMRTGFAVGAERALAQSELDPKHQGAGTRSCTGRATFKEHRTRKDGQRSRSNSDLLTSNGRVQG